MFQMFWMKLQVLLHVVENIKKHSSQGLEKLVLSFLLLGTTIFSNSHDYDWLKINKQMLDIVARVKILII